MKKILKSVIVRLLAVFARLVLRRYRPKMVMVTGSVGKTSTKDAVALVLSERFFVRKSEKSLNSEFGVPFTVLGVRNPWEYPLAWLGVVKSALSLILLPNQYPNMLVLEVGADHPGDLERILRIATPDAVVVTRLPEIPVHVEAYTSPEQVREEEFLPARALPAGAPLIVSTDDSYALDMAVGTPARVISYGIAENATVLLRAEGFYTADGKVIGMSAEVRMAKTPEGRSPDAAQSAASRVEERHTIAVEGAVGRPQILPFAAALATAGAFDIPLSDALKALKGYEPPPGRGRLLAGKNGAVLIDDSYNASPVANEEALNTLKIFPAARRRVAILGDMLELGRYSVLEHGRIGAIAAEAADVVIAVGIRARTFAAAAEGKAETLIFENARKAAYALKDFPQEGDVILVKGSQSIRMERIVEALLANSADASKLVRQEREWRRRP